LFKHFILQFIAAKHPVIRVWYPLCPNFISVFLIPSNFYPAASDQTIPRFPCNNILLRSLTQHKFISRLVLMSLLGHFYVFHYFTLSFTIFVIFLKLHSCSFLHTNANTVLYSSSFISNSQTPHTHITFLPPVILFCLMFCIQTHNPVSKQWRKIWKVHQPLIGRMV